MNPVVHLQILSLDPSKIEGFYTELFDWKLSRDDALQYRRMDTGQKELDVGIWPIDEGHNMVQMYIEVEDVPAMIERATTLGAQIVMPHQVLPDGDEMAILVDPAGMPIALKKKR